MVEDDPLLLDVLREILESEGFAVEAATDGWQALALALARPPATVVLDLNIPKLEGDEVAAALRLADGTAIPILVISGSPRGRAPWGRPPISPSRSSSPTWWLPSGQRWLNRRETAD